MSSNLITPAEKAACDEAASQVLYLNGYVVTRIIFELIKNYMISNAPKDCGVTLAQTYDIDPTKSGIKLDIGYNWKTDQAGKVPAVYVQRGDITLKNPTIGTHTQVDAVTGADTRKLFNSMSVTVSCIAAEPLAVVEHLAEYVKQPLVYFRKEVELDFGIRRLALSNISAPKLAKEGKNNFYIDLTVDVVFDDNWQVTRDSLKMRRIGVELFDMLTTPLQSIQI